MANPMERGGAVPGAVALVPCPACARSLSPVAAACPQCGHPMRAAATVPACHACEAPATSRCQRCGVLSCVSHLRSVFAWYGQGGSNELRCAKCVAVARAAMRWSIAAVVVVGGVVLLLYFSVLRRVQAIQVAPLPPPDSALPLSPK